MKVIEKVLQKKKIHKVGWCSVRFCRFVKFHKRSISGSVKFSEVQTNSLRLEQFFSKVLKRLRRSCKVLQGSEVPFGSTRFDNEPQDFQSWKWIFWVLHGSVRLYCIRRGSKRFTMVL